MASLVVCSNTSNEYVSTAGQSNSIYKAFNFRNDLSSTMMLPANCQVALQSCKYNVDGRIAIGDRTTFYMYYGEDVKEEGDEDLDKSTAVPVRVEINDGQQIEEYTAEELASAIEKSLNEYTYHPNKRDKFTCDTYYDSSTQVFKGFKISAGLFTATDSSIPADNLAEYWGDENDKDDELWTYESGVFTTAQVPLSQDGLYDPVIILKDNPISLYDGKLKVDFSDTNDAGLEWAVGLSRYGIAVEESYPAPSYFESTATDDIGQWKENFFGDYVVHREGVNLRVSVCTGDSGALVMRNINYTDNSTSHFYEGSIYNIDTNADNYTKVKFTLDGQRVKIELIDNTASSVVLIEYDSTVTNKRHNLPPIVQPKWQLHPILYSQADNTNYGNTLTVEEYVPCSDIVNFNIETDSWNFSSSFDYVDILGLEIETRPFNDYADGDNKLTTYAGIKSGDNPVIELDDLIITKPDDVYIPSFSANTESILGFSGRSPMRYFTFADASTTTRDFQSVSIPSMLTPKSLFVRLQNFNQRVMNAHNGNRSSIIAHLPKRDDSGVEIGSLHYEPKNLVFLDIGNVNPIPVNSFDLSICYVNEQYAEIVSGQTIVCLLFREDPRK